MRLRSSAAMANAKKIEEPDIAEDRSSRRMDPRTDVLQDRVRSLPSTGRRIEALNGLVSQHKTAGTATVDQPTRQHMALSVSG